MPVSPPSLGCQHHIARGIATATLVNRCVGYCDQVLSQKQDGIQQGESRSRHKTERRRSRQKAHTTSARADAALARIMCSDVHGFHVEIKHSLLYQYQHEVNSVKVLHGASVNMHRRVSDVIGVRDKLVQGDFCARQRSRPSSKGCPTQPPQRSRPLRQLATYVGMQRRARK